MREHWVLAALWLSSGTHAQSPLVVTVAVRTCAASSIRLSLSTVLPTYSSVPYGSSSIPAFFSSTQSPQATSSSSIEAEPVTDIPNSQPNLPATNGGQSPSASQSVGPIPFPSYASGEDFASPDVNVYTYERDTVLVGTTIDGSGNGLRKRQGMSPYVQLMDCVEECDDTPQCVAISVLGQSCLLYAAVESETYVLGAQAAYNTARFTGFVDETPTSSPASSTAVDKGEGQQSSAPSAYSTPMISKAETLSTALTDNPPPYSSPAGGADSVASPALSMVMSKSQAYSTPLISTDHATSFTPPPSPTSVLSTILPVTLSIPSSLQASSSPAMRSSSHIAASSVVGSSVVVASSPLTSAAFSSPLVSSRSESPFVSATYSETLSLWSPSSSALVPTPMSTDVSAIPSHSAEEPLPTPEQPTSSLQATSASDDAAASASDVPPEMTPLPEVSASSEMPSIDVLTSSATSQPAESPSSSLAGSSSAAQEYSGTIPRSTSSPIISYVASSSFTSSSAMASPSAISSSSLVQSSSPTLSTPSSSSSTTASSTSSRTPSSSSQSSTSRTSTIPAYSLASTSSSRRSSSSLRISSSPSPSSSRTSSTSSSSSRTSSSPSIPSATPVRNAGKRGLCYTNDTLTKPYSLSGQNSQVSWGYNYYYQNNTSPNSTDFNPALTFIPLLFNDDPNLTKIWPAYAQTAIDNGADSLLGFNEPDLCYPGSACMTVAQSVRAWRSSMEPFAGRARLGAPAVTNGGPPGSLQWLGEFLGNCSDCTVDFVPIHWYSNVYAFSYLQYYVQLAHNVTGKPIWVTEFGIDASGGSEQQYQAFLQLALPWLDAVPYVERYAYFYDGPGYLITPDGSGLSAQGVVYNSYTAPCPDWQNTQGHC